MKCQNWILWIFVNVFIMVQSCAALGCTNHAKKASGISFHRFPHHKKELLQKWIQAVRRKDFVPSKTHCLCSIHFTPACFKQGKKHQTLKEDAVPTVFPGFPEHLQKIVLRRKSPVKRKAEEYAEQLAKKAKLVCEHSYSKKEVEKEDKWKQRSTQNEPSEPHPGNPMTILAETILLQNDLDHPNDMRDTILYYIAGFLVRSLLPHIKCQTCREALCQSETNCHAFESVFVPTCAKFTIFKEKGGLVFPSMVVWKIVKTTELIFRHWVIEEGIGISSDKKLFYKVQNAVLQQYGPDVFACPHSHFFEHKMGAEIDHMSTMIRRISEKYLTLRMATYARKYSEMVIHQN